MNIKNPENFDINFIDNIKDKLHNLSEMSLIQQRFLNGIIRQIKPKKILEVGVAAGGSSAIILNAIKDIENSFLYSIDYSESYYRDYTKKTGFIVEEQFYDLKSKWKLYTGGLATKFMDEIGGEIDLCLLDTVHSNPGEFIDFLIILPYLKKNAILILHDITLYHRIEYLNCVTCGILFSALKGSKLIPNENEFGHKFGNIGMIVLDDDIKDRIFDYFYLLTLPWAYSLNNEDTVNMSEFVNKHYGDNYFNMFLNIALHYRDKYSNFNNNINNKVNNIDNKVNNIDNKVNNIDNKVNKLINQIAWWIPVKKWRDNFRNKLFQTKP